MSDRLPAVPEPAEPVLSGQPLPPAPARPVLPLRAVRVVAVRPEHVRAAGRHAGYVPLGAAVVIRRLWESRTTARYDRMLNAAIAAGNQEAALEWEERLARFRRERHARRMDLLALPGRVLAVLPKVVLGVFSVLLALSVLTAVAARKLAAVALPVEIAAQVVMWTAVAVSATWLPVLGVTAWAGLGALWWTGKRAAEGGQGPLWARTAIEDDADAEVTESSVTRAIAALRVPQVTTYLKAGVPLPFIVPCRIDGRGTYCEVRLPAGVTASLIARRRAQLASGLYRRAGETWPSTGEDESILRLWVADKGALAEGSGPYSLLTEGIADFFKGVPFGRTLRGDPIMAPLNGRNTIVGGTPGQGKSNAARVIVAGACLDPTVELRIWVPDANFDFEHFKRRCSVYVMGAEDEKIRDIRDALAALHAEVQERGRLLVAHGEQEVTRRLADTVPGLHPLVCLLEEAHVAVGHPEYGKEIASLLIEIVRLGRKRAIHIIVSTQAPTRDSIPRDVTRNCSNGIAFAVGDHVANDALLGQGAYSAGHRATELIQGTDRGTAVVRGFSGERSEVVQVYRLDVSAGRDEVTPLVRRSLAEIARRGRPVPGAAGTMAAPPERDLIADLRAVTAADGERVRLADLPARLRELAPRHLAYRELTGARLRELLEDRGIRVTNTGNVPRLDPADLPGE